MKLKRESEYNIILGVALRGRAWIEIGYGDPVGEANKQSPSAGGRGLKSNLLLLAFSALTPVALRGRAWIEISCVCYQSRKHSVALRGRAWIEI